MTHRGYRRTLALCIPLALASLASPAQTPAPVGTKPAAPTAPLHSRTIAPEQLASAEDAFTSHTFGPESYVPIFVQAADQGSAAAKRDLGLVFLTGSYNGPIDHVLALQWFEAASLAGDTRAASYIGDFYLDPKNTNQNTNQNSKPDPVNARFFYEKADKAHDARGTIALAALSCNGTGTRVDLPHCGTLLDTATSFKQPSDPADVTASLKLYDILLGAAYHAGKGVPRNNTLAASWYDKAAKLGSVPAALAESKLYIEPGGLPQNLPKATAILDAITLLALAGKTPSLCEPAQFAGHDDITQAYVEIGAKYEARGPRSFPQALAVYNKAASLGDGAPIIALGLRYANGTGVPQDLGQAQTILLALTKSSSIKRDDRNALGSALETLATRIAAKDPADTASAALLTQAAMRERLFICPTRSIVAPAMAAPPAPVERYPNLQAPDTVAPLQTFTVQVSLNTIQFDDNTQILNGDQDNGQLRFHLPDGMTSMPIDVALIAPGMTFVGGSTNTATLILDETNPNSTPATFQVQAPATPKVTELLATLSYHQTFLAQLARNLTIAVATPTSAPAPQAPIVTVQPPAPAQQPAAKLSSAPRPIALLSLQSKPPQQPFLPNPTDKLSDLTIIETLVGDSMSYQILGPGIDPAAPVLVPDAAATAAKVRSDYAQLQSQARVLAAGTGTACAADRASNSKDPSANGSDTDASCGDAVFSRGLIEGIGTDLYLHDAPDSFRTVYQQMLAAHTRLHSITIVTNNPLLPWELLCVPAPSGKGCNFLGLTTAIVRENSAAPQLAQPAGIPFSTIDVVAPNYTGTLALAGAAAEIKSIQADFPAMQQVGGDANSVALMIKSAPEGIVHFTGHGKRVDNTPAPLPSASPAATPSTASAPPTTAVAAPSSTPSPALVAAPPPDTLLAPHVAIALEDYDMTPDTFVAFRAEGNASAHPFYFFNACDLGQSDSELTYVAGWAPDLMRSGAAGYLGALYEVGDASAASFAAHFYAGLKTNLAGTGPWTMSDLVTQARQQTYAESNDPTALAYVLYAKPFMTLIPTQPSK